MWISLLGTIAFAQSSNPLTEGRGRPPHPDPTSDSFDTTCAAFATSRSWMTRVDRNYSVQDGRE